MFTGYRTRIWWIIEIVCSCGILTDMTLRVFSGNRRDLIVDTPYLDRSSAVVMSLIFALRFWFAVIQQAQKLVKSFKNGGNNSIMTEKPFIIGERKHAIPSAVVCFSLALVIGYFVVHALPNPPFSINHIRVYWLLIFFSNMVVLVMQDYFFLSKPQKTIPVLDYGTESSEVWPPPPNTGDNNENASG